jgi:hypothetical protein
MSSSLGGSRFSQAMTVSAKMGRNDVQRNFPVTARCMHEHALCQPTQRGKCPYTENLSFFWRKPISLATVTGTYSQNIRHCTITSSTGLRINSNHSGGSLGIKWVDVDFVSCSVAMPSRARFPRVPAIRFGNSWWCVHHMIRHRKSRTLVREKAAGFQAPTRWRIIYVPTSSPISRTTHSSCNR